jgi:hypothetical protein
MMHKAAININITFTKLSNKSNRIGEKLSQKQDTHGVTVLRC